MRNLPYLLLSLSLANLLTGLTPILVFAGKMNPRILFRSLVACGTIVALPVAALAGGSCPIPLVSQLQPGTFGGTSMYTFPDGLNAGGPDYATSYTVNNNGPAVLTLTDTQASPPTMNQSADIYFLSTNTNPLQGFIEAGSAGATIGNPGGFMAFHTKADDGPGTDAEALILTPGHHVEMPLDQFYVQLTTSGACSAGVACGTVTWTFTTPYASTSGVLQQPNCPDINFQDLTTPSQMWVGGVNAISSTAVTYNYAPLTAVASAHTLEVYAECHEILF